jgi:hypothetical protein
MEERIMKKSHAEEDEEYMFLMSLLTSIKRLDDIQRLELRIEFMSRVTSKIRISKNLSPPFNCVPTACNSLYPQSPSPRAESLE